MMMLPEELLHRIVKHLVYEPNIEERDKSEFQLNHATKELRSLSVVDRRLRRICFPLLFEYVTAQEERERYQGFLEQCANSVEFASSIKALRVSGLRMQSNGEQYPGDFTQPERSNLLRQTLLSLPRLSWIDLSNLALDRGSMKALHDHQTIATVMIESIHNLPKDIGLDLSKVVASSHDVHEGFLKDLLFEQYLACGGQVWSLWIQSSEPPQLNKLLSVQVHGIHEFDFRLVLHTDIAWLHKFACCHPSLQKITVSFYDEHKPNSIPFLQSFFEELDSTELQEIAISVTVERQAELVSTTDSWLEWRVIELKFKWESKSLAWGQILRRAHASFPHVSLLQLITYTSVENMTDFILALSPFTSLRTLKLQGIYGGFDFESPRSSWEPILELVKSADRFKSKPPKSIEAVAEIIWCASQIALAIPSFEAFYVKNDRKMWEMDGWLRVRRPLDAVASIDWEALKLY